MITQHELKKRISYDPITGIVLWVKTGKEAGRFDASSGYRRIKLEGKEYLTQRLIWLYMTGVWPVEVDHEDHQTQNNVWSNLQDVSHHMNGKNKRKQKNNKSGTTGVSWCAHVEKWNVQIYINKKATNLGRFKNKHKAIAVRKAAEVAYGYHPNHGK